MVKRLVAEGERAMKEKELTDIGGRFAPQE